MKSSKTSKSKPGLEVCALDTVFIYIAQTPRSSSWDCSLVIIDTVQKNKKHKSLALPQKASICSELKTCQRKPTNLVRHHKGTTVC